MLKREEAQKLLQNERTAKWHEHCLATIANDLTGDVRSIAYALLAHDEHGKPLRTGTTESYERQRAIVAQANARLGTVDSAERLAVFTALFPTIAPTVEAAWQLLGRLPYQQGWHRKAFRRHDLGSATTPAREQWLQYVVNVVSPYPDKDLVWLAAWAPYLGHGYGNQHLGILFAAAIEAGGTGGEAVFDVLTASARGEHAIGAMGRHVATALLVSSRPDGWTCIEKLLLAAQREEGLRQVILETVDEAHPEAFRRLLRLILDHDLIRFSATIRAADVWLGFGWDVDASRAARETLGTVLGYLDSADARHSAIAQGDAQHLYLALWAEAFTDALQAVELAAPIISDNELGRRLVATHLLGQLGLSQAQELLVPLLSDSDLRLALSAFAGLQRDGEARASSGLFERLEALLARLKGKAGTLESGVWPWLKLNVNEGAVADALLPALGQRLPTRLIPHLSCMSQWARVRCAKLLVEQSGEDAPVREVILGLAADRSSWVREEALKLIARRPVTSEEALPLEGLLTRKSSDLRRSVLSLLLKQDDDGAFASAERLLDARHPLQRVAGLDLLRELTHAQRRVEPCREVARRYQVERSTRSVLSAEEETLLTTILADGQAELNQPNIENVLGLIKPQERTQPVPPRPHPVIVDTPAARACLLSLDALVETHRATPVMVKSWNGTQEALLGNLNWQSLLPGPDPAGYHRTESDLPLAELWQGWEHGRPANLRDRDGLELIRALLLVHGTHAATTPRIVDRRTPWDGFTRPPTEAVTPDAATTIHLQDRYMPRTVLSGLVRLHEPTSPAALEYLLDVAETALTTISMQELAAEATAIASGSNHGDVRAQLHGEGAVTLLRQYMAWHPTLWADTHHVRRWQLLHWFDQPQSNMPRKLPELSIVLAAYKAGGATEADILDQLVAPVTQSTSYYSIPRDLSMLSGRAPHALAEQYPVLQKLVPALRERILEVELARGEMPTPATPLARALRFTGGMTTFVQVLTALGAANLDRGQATHQSRADTFSHLLRATYPSPDDTVEEFTRQIRAARIDTKRLIAAAVYAPQWARYIEQALDWPSLEEAVWWTHAHTKDSNWTIDQQLRTIWQAEAAERTPLTAQDLLDGAVDVGWFWRSYQELGPTRWEEVYEAAKYASGGTGHGRARLFADAMIGKLTTAELRQRITGKRQQDAVRALGLVPLVGQSAEARQAELAERYQAIQEFVRTGKAFGSQRRASEELAARIGMENLARTAGYPDPIRLQWAMEAHLVADLRDGALSITEGEVTVTLSLDPFSAAPQITISRAGKALKTLPTALKKNAAITALTERKHEIERQVSRMRGSLEGAMCRGDRFTANELAGLLAHPVLAKLLRNLVFVQDDPGKESATVLGYPVLDEQANGSAPRCLFRGHHGSLHVVDPEAATLRLAHPHDLFASGDWHVWQHECFTAERIQPFKQIFRELYVLSGSEMRTGNEAASYRYSGHQVQPKQALALFGQRGWVAQPEEGVRRTFHVEGLSASVDFASGIFTPAEVEGLTIDSVLFTRRADWQPVPLASVPPRIFSEVMRDMDLVVSVAHRGGVDPEATASTVEMRATLVQETCTLLGLANVATRSAHALVEGKLGSYSVHLGSAIVHRQPGGALCIVPVHSQHRGRLFLPFTDDDPKTAEVISKVILLARDSEIKDPSILEQIL